MDKTYKNVLNTATRLDYFLIGLSPAPFNNITKPIRGKYPLCGQYPYLGQVSFGHKVTCDPTLPAYRYLIAQQAFNATWGFTICEIEAFPMEGIVVM